jgi:hypothetical protein
MAEVAGAPVGSMTVCVAGMAFLLCISSAGKKYTVV